MSKSFLKKALLGGAVAAGAAVWAIAPRSFSDKRRHYVPAVPDVWYAHRGLHDAGSGLVIMTLPTIIRTTQESLKTVPQSYREGSLGLGAGKWHMIRTVVLPSSVDGIVTGCILAIGRIVGESAVLLYTVGMSMSMQDYFRDGLSSLLQSSGSTLTVALYVYAKERADFDLAFSVAVVLLVITLVINLAAKLVGKGLRKK